MNSLERASQISIPNYLRELRTTPARDNHGFSDLFGEFLQQETYSRSLCLRLVAIAKQSSGVSWDARRLAVLMLEHQCLKLPPHNIDDFDFLLTLLNLKPALGVNIDLFSSVLKEGYSTTELRRFIPELRRKLERLNHVHRKIKGKRSSENAVRDFIELSRRDCKLSLARYIFEPEQVVAQILKQLEVTEGVKDVDASQPSYVDNEVRRAMNLLPDFEAAILKKLCESSKIYWVSDATGSEINSLIEYPLTTVVLVVKPPGSNIEFEIKRAGRKGAHRLNVVYARNGYTVTPSHRLDGGSMLWLLRYEANAAHKLSIIYRLVHGTEAPISSYLARANIFSVPVRNTAVPLLRYFTESQIFGQGFREMRVAMEESIDAFQEEGDTSIPVLPSDLGLTVQFTGHVTPAQSILAGTSSFRLDKLALYLSSRGPKRYFEEGLHAAHTKRDARRLADELLEEILGVYEPPEVRYQSYTQYLAAAFSVAENRVRADHIYLSLVRQIGNFWGTLLGVRGSSRGESFVARNVGLKSFWDNGRWGVKIIFMDHDALSIPGSKNYNFLPQNALPCMALDERYIWGGTDAPKFAISEVGYLQNIYRIGEDVRAKGELLARKALKDAYKKTQNALLNNSDLRRFFNKMFLERLTDWDRFVSGYFRTAREPSARIAWKQEMEKMLSAKGYREYAFASFVTSIEANIDFLKKYSFLFDPQEEGVHKKAHGSKRIGKTSFHTA